jgi:hypothetical protein
LHHRLISGSASGTKTTLLNQNTAKKDLWALSFLFIKT